MRIARAESRGSVPAATAVTMLTMLSTCALLSAVSATGAAGSGIVSSYVISGASSSTFGASSDASVVDTAACVAVSSPSIAASSASTSRTPNIGATDCTAARCESTGRPPLAFIAVSTAACRSLDDGSKYAPHASESDAPIHTRALVASTP